MNKRIHLSLASMGGHEQEFINQAFNTNWIAPLGPNVDGFENDLKVYLSEEKCVVALITGTAALHIGLIMLDVRCGDEVICQSFTFSASANPIKYLGAKPIFIDSEFDTWNMSPQLLEEAILDRKKKTGKFPKAIILVHLYGMPAKINEIIAISQKYKIPILEDAAEALGSTFYGQKCGTFGEFGILSFNGNKIITTSGGGALICRTNEIANRIKFFASQARDDAPHNQHSHIGYNYRMSNICAGIGRGQMLVLEEHIARRREIHALYSELFRNVDGITVKQNPFSNINSNFWLTCILIDRKIFRKTREDIRIKLESENIESRPLWKPMHLQPVFSDTIFYLNGVSEILFDKGLSLPSGPALTNEEVERVVKTILT